MKRLVVVGLGLIGGSVARAARARGLAETIFGIDVVPGNAAALGLDRWLSAADDADVELALKDADLVLIATPISAIPGWIERSLRCAKVVTDAGSAKRWIEAQTRSFEGVERFVSGHPMAGAPSGGSDAAREDLFEGQRWILCPGSASHAAVDAVRDFASALGAVPVELESQAHDRAVAFTSHVPQLVASAVLALGSERDALTAAGPGFASTTRIAGGPEAIWGDILRTNGDEIGGALRELIAVLEVASQGLDKTPPDTRSALELLARARKQRG